MKRGLFLALAVFFMAALLRAETRTDFNFGLCTDLADDLYVSGVRFNFIYGKAKEVNGASLGLINVTQGKLTGVESGFVNVGMETLGARAGFVNLLDGSVNGAISGFYNKTGSVTGASAGFINNINGDVNGAVSGFVNNVNGGIFGVVSGFVNSTGAVTGTAAGFVNNVQFIKGVEAGFINSNMSVIGATAGFVNLIGTVDGLESGFVNASNEVNGCAAGFVNAIGAMNGVETGFVNVSDKATGIMAGFVNVCGELDGAALGAVNVIKGGFGKISAYSTVESLYNLAFKSGKGFYGILGAGYDMRETKFADKYTATCGLGYHFDAKPFFIDWEILHNMYFRNISESFDWKKDLNAGSEFRILPGVNFGDIIDIYAGPSVQYRSHGEITKRDSWRWTRDSFRVSAVAGINIRVF